MLSHGFTNSLLAFLVLVSTPTWVQAKQFMLASGSLVPEKTADAVTVEWSSLFREKISIQQAGSCHVFSATALMEAMCKSKTGKSIKLSESYFFYEHLMEEVKQGSLLSLTSVKFFDEAEGGFVEDTLARFHLGSVVVRGEFPSTIATVIEQFKKVSTLTDSFAKSWNQNYQNDLKTIVTECNDNTEVCSKVASLNDRYAEKLKDQVCRRVNGQVVCKSKTPLASSSEKASIETKDQNLLTCLKASEGFETKEAPTTKEIVDLLDAKKPVICSSDFVALSGSPLNDRILADTANHATIIYGYRYSYTLRRYEFLVRDSNFENLKPYTVTGCDTIYSFN